MSAPQSPRTPSTVGTASSKFIAFVLLAVVLVRLCTLGAYPLGSTTEPRYAEIARKMLETGNWITPWFDHGVPFWGKPPLSFWGSAATMAIFGVNEFGVRLAPFVAALGCAALFWAWPRDARVKAALPLAASVVLFSSVVGFIASAAVMTDMFMAFSTTLCMVAFWVAVNDSTAHSPWRWVFFVGVALGLLAKGPVATVVTGLALGSAALLFVVFAPRPSVVGYSMLAAQQVFGDFTMAFSIIAAVGIRQRHTPDGARGRVEGAIGTAATLGTVVGMALAAWLGDQGYPTRRLASRKAYRVLEVAAR